MNSVFVGEFDEPLDPISVTTQSVALRDNSTFQQVPVTVALNPDGRTITLAPTRSLVVNHSYTLFFNFNTGCETLSVTSVVVPVVYGFSADYRTVTLTPTAPLAAGTQHTIAVTNFSVRDLAGNFIANIGTANFVTQ